MADAALTDPFDPPIATDPATIREEQHQTMQAAVPGWLPRPRKLDYEILATAAETSAETRQALAQRLRTEVTDLLGDLFRVPRLDGTAARSTVTVTTSDAAGHTWDAGERVWVGEIECATTEELVVDAGSTVGVVPIEAVEPGVFANGATAVPQLENVYDWVDTVTLDDPLDAGVDPETDVEYGNRLRDEMQLVALALIHASDGVTIARRYPQVGWAVGIKGYDAQTGETGQDRTVTYVVADAAGGELPAGVTTSLHADLQARRETNWVVRVAGPVHVGGSVVATVTVEPSWADKPAAVDAARQRLLDRLSPGGHLTPPYGADPGYVPDQRIHRHQLIAEAAGEGILRVESLILSNEASEAVDYIDLPSPRHLPNITAVTVTEAT